jgi:hypothetical protein
VPCHLLEIQTTTPHGDPAVKSAHEPILVVTMHGVADTFNTVIDETTHGTDFQLVNLVLADNEYLTHQDMNTSIDNPETNGIFTLCHMIL